MNNETNVVEINETSTIVAEMTYDQKMDFLAQIRKEVGLDKVVTADYIDESPAGKYITEYTFGTI
jgi:hypothetical protein